MDPASASGAPLAADGRDLPDVAANGRTVGLEEKARRASSDAALRRARGDGRSGIERSAAALHPGFLRAVVGSRSSTGSSRGSASSGPRPGPIERCPTGTSFHTRETLGTRSGRIPTNFSADEYERLRRENRLLREEHARKYAAEAAGGGQESDAPPREIKECGESAGGQQPQKQQPVTHSTLTAPASNAAPSKAAEGDNAPEGDDNESNRGSAKENNGANGGRPSASGLYASNLPAQLGGGQHGILKPIKNLSKLTGTLFRKPSDDEMSFFVTGEDGHVEKRAVALVAQDSDEAVGKPGSAVDTLSGGDGNTTIASGRSDGTGQRRRAPQSPLPASGAGAADAPLKSVRKVATKAARLTRESVDALAHDVGPRLVSEIDKAARITAKGVMQATKESVDGLGMMVTDLAKTPARSNVNGQRNVQFAKPGVVGGYVHDPDYRVVLTPVEYENQGRMDVPYGRHFNPSTPGVLFGAVAAAKCDLPSSHPDSLGKLPDGIPSVLVVHEDWEERAGFVPMRVLEGDIAAAADDDDAEGLTAAAGTGHKRRVSEPVDLDKVEIETVGSDGGESSGSELELRLSNGFDEDDELPIRPESAVVDEVRKSVNFECDAGKEERGSSESEKKEDSTDEGEDPRNHSMWVAAPVDEDVEGDDYAMEVGQVSMTDLIDQDEEDEMLASTPHSAMSGGTFFVGDIDAVGESPPSPEAEAGGAPPAETVAEEKVAEKKTAADLALERAFEVFGDAVPLDGLGAAGVGKAEKNKSSAEVEELASKIESIGLQDFPGVSLPAPALMASPAQMASKKAVVPFETPHSVRKGDRPMSMTEFKAMNGAQRPHDAAAAGAQAHEELGQDEGRPATSEEARRMTQHSESTDLSLYSNWAKPVVAGQQGGKQRELKGRILLVRIKKKITKVGKKAHRFFLPFVKNKPPRLSKGEFVISLTSNCSPGLPHGALPNSPTGSVISAVSIASSLVTGGRIIGAAPPKADGVSAPLYGAINYGTGRGSEDSSAGDDELPAPPSGLQLPVVRAGSAEEDAASFLAEVMRKHSDDGEDSLMLLVTPGEDGTEEVSHVISAAADGTPIQIQEVLGNPSDAVSDMSPHEPSNLQALFTGGAGNAAPPLQIVDAVEIEGQGILLTPRNAPSENNASSVFRPSNGPSFDAGDNLLAPSENGTHEDEDESLLFHDGETLVRPSSTMCDNTIGTASSGQPNSVPQTTPVVDEEVQEETANETAPAESRKEAEKTPFSPGGGVPVSRTAEKQRSFLFSPNNLGRAEPSVRAAQRAKNKAKSITLLPPSSEPNNSGTTQLTVKRYSHESQPSEVEERDVLDRPVRKGVMASVTKPRQFPFQTTKGKFEEDDSARPETPVDTEETSGKYPVTPFPDEAAVTTDEAPVEAAIETPVDTAETVRKYPVTPFPDVAAVTEAIQLNTPTNANSPTAATSPSNTSVYSKNKRKSLPKKKSPPTKSTSKMLRQGNVRARASAINERAAAMAKKERRGTNGDGVLAPRHSKLKPSYLGGGASYYNRSVPIGIAKTYTRDSESYHSLSIGNSSSLEEASADGGKNNSSYASRYIAGEEPRPSISWGSAVSTDASSCAESSSGGDPFSTLLAAADRDSDDDEETVEEVDEKRRVSNAHNKENESNLLPFRTAESHVKPSELNHHQRPALSPQPMPPQTWRRLAVAAKEKKEGGDSSRFRTEKSVRDMFASN